MIRHTITISALLLLTAVTAISQAVTHQWTKEKNLTGYQRVVAQKDGAIFLERSLYGPVGDTNYESELARYDAQGKVTHIIEVRDLETKPHQVIATVDSKEALAALYISTDEQDKQYYMISAQLYGHADLAPGSIVDLMKVKSRSQSEAKIKSYRDGGPLSVERILSPDKTKVAIVVTENDAGKQRSTVMTYAVFDLQDNFRELNSGSVETEKASTQYLLQDLDVNNTGELAILMKEYLADSRYEFVNDKPSYRYSVYFNTANTDSYIYDIYVKTDFIDNMQAALSDEGTVFVSGLTREKPEDDVYGTRFIKLMPTGDLAYDKVKKYSDKEIKIIRNKDKDNLQPAFETIDMRVAQGAVYAIHQYSQVQIDFRQRDMRFGAFGNNIPLHGGRVDQFYDKRNVVVQAYETANGNMLWMANNPRNQEDRDELEYFSFGNIHMYDNGLLFLYNDRPDNLARMKENKNPKQLTLPRGKGTVMLVRISDKGRITYDIVSDNDNFHIPYEGSLMTGNSISTIAIRQGYRKFKIGEILLN